jgi:hypothetical protein
VNALLKADKNEMTKLSPEDEFYVNMFQYISNGQAGQKILLLTSDSHQFDSDLTNIRIMKKFSKNFNLALHAVSSFNFISNINLNQCMIFLNSQDYLKRFSHQF